MQEVKTTRKRLPKRGAHARALAAAAAAESRELDIDDDEMSHTVLQRGSACLSCRKRKLKCDAVRPACRKCTTAGRADECHYDDGKQKTRTQLLQEKVKELEEKLKSLESGSNGSDEGDSMLSPDQPPALAPAIVSLSNGTISPNGQASEQLSGGYGRGLFEDPPVNERTHYDALLNRDTGTLQVFNQQEHSGNLLDVANGQAPPWLGEFSNFETSSGSKTVDTDFAGIPLAGTSDGGLERQLTAYLNGSSLSSGTNVGFSSMPSTSGQPAAPSQFIDITASYGVVPDPALSFTLDAFPDIDGVPARWLDQDHLPTHIRNYLIDLFMPHRHRCGFEVHIGRFLASLDLPINKRPHPCLMNAIYLLGCHYAPGGSLSHLEPLFLSRARTALAESLEHADRLKDFLFASALLACYFYFKGRLLEGQHHNSAAVRFAMSCGLHQISSPVWRGSEYATTATGSAPWQVTSMSLRRAGSMLDPPRDPIELYELINIFWLTFITDRAGSLGTGLPHAIKDDEITTVFPRPLQEFEEGTVTNDTNATITNMYEDGNHAQDASKDSLHCLRVKSLALLERSSRLSTVPEEERDKKFWGEFWATDRALERIAQTLPHIHSGMGINDTSSLIFVHTFVQGSTIQLHLPFVETDSGSYDRSVKAADAAMNVVHMIDNIDAKNFHMLMGLSWICVSDILKREIHRKRGIADDEGARRTERELEALFAAMKRLRQVYPVLGVYGLVKQDLHDIFAIFFLIVNKRSRSAHKDTNPPKLRMLAYSLLAGALYSRHHKDYLVSPPSFYNIMSDLHSRTPNVGPAKQRRTRRAQPYPSSSSSALYHEVREPGASNLDTPTIEPSSALSSPAANSSRTSSDAASSPNDGLCGPAPPNPTTILQRGSACLTCRRRKLKCDAIKPACTSCVRSGRSQTCTYDDGLPKSRVQILTSKVRDLEAKIRSMEATRQSLLVDTSSLQVPPMLMPGNPPPLDTGSMSSLRVSSPNHNSDIWKPLDSGQNELINLAASLAVTDSTSLESQRGQIVDTSRRMTPWWELDEIPTGIQEHLISTFLARRWEVRDGVQISGMDIDSVLPPFLGSPALSLTFHDCGRLFLKSRHINLTRDKSFEDLQPIFVSRVRKELEAALVGGDRLIDFIPVNGRLLEGHQLSSTTARFAIACGLHRIDSERWCPQPEHGSIDATRDPVQSRGEDMVPGINGELHMLPRPRDNIERNEYIHAFWGVYMQDIGGLPRTTTAALVTGLPSSVADSEITTPWPVHLDQVIPLNHQPGQTIASFYCGLAGTANMSQDRHSQTIRIKSMCLLGRAVRLSIAFESVRYPELGLWAKHDACDKAITEASRSFPAGLEHIGPEGSLILASRATLLAAQIRLHACLAATRPESREKCLAAAAESMALILRLRYVMIPTGILLLLGLDWTVVKSFYVAEQSRLLKEGNYLAAEAIGKNVEEIGSELESVPAKYPGIEL
ncbi:unnamed protein product [Rhizoctonia solani]|uniref:Zn(2)-C6 fungal-type domain-containing protein n=1 Tax=Rhizoctonia solani TaxID=456999 RepID=A0A8H2WBS8_9AGAM|nr:unnamed protein product [Rhizoctonia solani]